MITATLRNCLILAMGLCACGPKNASAPDSRTRTAAINDAHTNGSQANGEPARTPASSATLKPPEFRLPTDVRPIQYILDLHINPEQPTFRGRVSVEVEFVRPTQVLWLNARELDVSAGMLTRNDRTSPTRVIEGGAEFVGFVFDKPQSPGRATLSVTYQGKFQDKKTIGLYRVKEDTGWHAYTMFEPLDARRAFPCFDEPAYKVPWQLIIHTPGDHVAVANAPLEAERADITNKGTSDARDPGAKVFTFLPSKPLPSYLVAFVVGPFDIIDSGTVGKNAVRLRFVVPRGRADELSYARQSTPRVVELLERYLGIPYPYRKLDVAVVPRFWGTMEHPGLVAMGQSLTLIKPDEHTPQRRKQYANILAHELGHYWFGDLVTHAWWDDIWLNEGLGTWLDQKITRQFEASWAYEFENLRRRDSAMYSDSLLSAKRVREPAESNDAIANSFDNSITYDKGAQIVGMFENWLGEPRFQAAIQHYLTRYAWKSARSEDFIKAMDSQLDGQFGAPFRTFLDQSGHPLLTVELQCQGNAKPRLSLTQKRFVNTGTTDADPQLWSFPVCVRHGVGKRSARQCMLMSERKAIMELSGTNRCPEWVNANEASAGYYRVAYKGDMASILLGKAAPHLTLVERVGVVSDLNALARSGDVTVDRLFRLIPQLIRGKNRHMVSRSLSILGWANRFMPDELRPNYARYVRRTYGAMAHELGWRKRKGDTDNTIKMRPMMLSLVAIAGEDRKLQKRAIKLAYRYLKDPSSIDPGMVGTVLSIASHAGNTRLFEAYLAQARATKERRTRVRLLVQLSRFPDKKLVERALALALGDEFDARESTIIIQAALYSRETRDLAYAFIKRNFEALRVRLSDLSATSLFYLPGAFCEPSRIADARAFLTRHVDSVEGARPVLKKSLEGATTCVAMRAIHEPGVRAFLRKQ